MFDKGPKTPLGKAKSLPQVRVRLFKKATVPDTNSFFTILYSARKNPLRMFWVNLFIFDNEIKDTNESK